MRKFEDEKWVMVAEDDNAARYILGTKGQKTLCCLGINPSTAAPYEPDPTIRSVERIAKNNGYDSFAMINIYPTRCTVFENLSREENEEYTRQNLKYIEKLVESLPKPVNIWVAHGNLVDKRAYTKKCLEQLRAILAKYDCRYWHCGKTHCGNPRHPLFMKSETKLQEFEWK